MKLPMMPPVRFCPGKDVLLVLNNRRWLCSYSGGKDSTALVTWIEWLRRIGMVKCDKPALVMSDTTVEYPFLGEVASRIMTVLTASGWCCEVVTPLIHERLYNRIFGIGNTPTHPGIARMRWCTRSTKIDPMKRFAQQIADDVVQLSGVRFGESASRDAKLTTSGCAAGGECGLPEPGEGVFGPIISWTLCKVIEWLSGKAGVEVNSVIGDLLPHMKELVEVYDVKQHGDDLFGNPSSVVSLRFGCIGCPAITNEKISRSRQGLARPAWSHLKRIHAIWQQLYLRKNRCCRINKKGSPHFGKVRAALKKRYKKPTWCDHQVGFGPIRMEVRKHYFAELLDIQEKSGVTLVTEEDVAFIHDCWARNVYPRGWGPEDELVQPPDETMFREEP